MKKLKAKILERPAKHLAFLISIPKNISPHKNGKNS